MNEAFLGLLRPSYLLELTELPLQAQESGSVPSGGVGSLREGVSAGMDFIKRRFSSSDADDEAQTGQPTQPPPQPPPTHQPSSQAVPGMGTSQPGFSFDDTRNHSLGEPY